MQKKRRLLVNRKGINFALVRDCRSAWEVGRGLLGAEEPAINENNLFEGVLLRIPAWRQKFSGLINSIHMIGMKYPISVFWISDGIIVDKILAVPGWHIYSSSHPASEVLELPEAAFEKLNIGDSLKISETDCSISTRMK